MSKGITVSENQEKEKTEETKVENPHDTASFPFESSTKDADSNVDDGTIEYVIRKSGEYMINGEVKFFNEGDVVKIKKPQDLEKKDTKQKPMPAHLYHRLTNEEKKEYFPVNRAMRRKHGIR